MDQTFYDLKRLFRRELDEVIKHKTTAVMGGSCADYIMYKAEVGKYLLTKMLIKFLPKSSQNL